MIFSAFASCSLVSHLVRTHATEAAEAQGTDRTPAVPLTAAACFSTGGTLLPLSVNATQVGGITSNLRAPSHGGLLLRDKLPTIVQDDRISEVEL